MAKKNIFTFRKTWIYLVALSLLSLASFWRIVFFYFFQDDYQFLWYALYHPLFFITFRHPGTPLEAVIFSPLFGSNPMPWQLFGIFLKVYAAYLAGILFYKMTNSKVTAILSAIFFAVSYTGMYVIYSFNYHVAGLVTIPILLSLIYFIKSIRESTHNLWKFVVFLLLAIALDPARILPIFLILPFFLFLFPKSQKHTYVRHFLKKFVIALCIVGVPLFLFWYVVVSKGAGTQFEIFLKGMVTNPAYMITKTKDAGNYFATMSNSFTGIIYELPSPAPKYETFAYSRILGVVGVGIFIGFLISLYYFLRRKSRFFGIVSFCIFWAYIFYFPNWLAEPRAPMTVINHYLYISSVGSLGLIAYLFSFLKKKWLLILLSILFIILSIYKANESLFLQSQFHSTVLIEKSWATIIKTAPKNKMHSVFFFTGDTYWANYSFMSFGSYEYLLLTKDPNSAHLPILTIDESYVMSLVCAPDKTVPFDSLYVHIPLSHIYTWNVKAPGQLVDVTKEQREKLEKEAQKRQCDYLP